MIEQEGGAEGRTQIRSIIKSIRDRIDDPRPETPLDVFAGKEILLSQARTWQNITYEMDHLEGVIIL